VVRHDEAAARAERAQAIGLFRYQLIRDAADPGLSSKARGRLVRSPGSLTAPVSTSNTGANHDQPDRCSTVPSSCTNDSSVTTILRP
jgi:hypothetical protein